MKQAYLDCISVENLRESDRLTEDSGDYARQAAGLGVPAAAVTCRNAPGGRDHSGHSGKRDDADMIEQFVMAYGIEQDRIRALLPEGYESLRPVLRINAEIRAEKSAYLEFNTPVAHEGKRGWLNIAHWQTPELTFRREDGGVVLSAPFLRLTWRGVGITGGCPAEKDNDGCFFPGETPEFRPAARITAPKEFCDCEFAWRFQQGDAHGVSAGKTIPAFFEEPRKDYPRRTLTAANAAAIPCRQVLGAYMVRFEGIPAPVPLRPHHGMCFRFYEGKGYSAEFTDHMGRVIRALSADPSREITLKVSGDLVCESCPNNRCGTCTDAEKVRRYDEAVLRICNLRAGARLPYGSFMELVKARVIRAGLRSEICGDCCWDAICRSKEAAAGDDDRFPGA